MRFVEMVSWAMGLTLLLMVILRSPLLAPEPTPPKAPRPLKPRTPQDCPVCRHPHPTPRWGNLRKPGVPPWAERHRPRGPRKHVCTAGYTCPQPTCDYSGNTDPTFHALVGNGVRGRDGIQQFKCQACSTQFSSRLDTAL